MGALPQMIFRYAGKSATLQAILVIAVIASSSCMPMLGGNSPPPEQGTFLDVPGIEATPVKVFYATDRRRFDQTLPVTYGADMATLQFGTAVVRIPLNHRKGSIERPSLFRLEFSEDPEKHVVITTTIPLTAEQYFEELRRTCKSARQPEIFIFVHGYRVTFDDALRRTAQLYYDLEFPGVPVLYSWPSQGSLLGYWADEETALISATHLKEFLIQLSKQTNANAIHLVGHSMGSRLITAALSGIVADPAVKLPAIDQLVFTAPDMYADYFKTFAPVLAKVARRTTLYASSNDKALSISKWFHRHPRAGESGDRILILPGIDTIDVSTVDTNLVGHFYYGDNRSVISDLFYLLRDKRPPTNRFGIKAITPDNPLYWAFIP